MAPVVPVAITADPARTVIGVDDPAARPATEADVLEDRDGGGGLSINISDMIAPAGLYASDRDMFAFLINERGVITSRGIINNGEHIRYVLSGPGDAPEETEETPPPAAERDGSDGSVSTANVQESDHVRKAL